MAVFVSLVKAVLLHATSEIANLLQEVKAQSARKLLDKVSKDAEYQDWLADRFFVFYLNRTKSF